jgi:LmbE family N-acetylglucosaminyl deacetylase
MTVVYILAHFDDEYCALPLIWQARREGLEQRFVYLADYRDRALGARRLAETHAFLVRQGLSPACARPLGLGSGAYDGSVWRHVGELLPRLAEEAGPARRIVTPAWEGGHMDHDACAWLGVRLAERTGAEARQFTLYNGPGLPGPLLRAGQPLAENGPVLRVPLSARERLRWMAAVRAYPSQLYAWSGIWPALAWGVLRNGFGTQALTAARVGERPHPGALFYERMFKVRYEEVRAALAAQGPAAQGPAAQGPAAQGDVRLMTTSPTRISPTPAQ